MRSTTVPEYNDLTVSFVTNVDLQPGSTITISNLTETLTASGNMLLLGTLEERLTFSQGAGTWEKDPGSLTLELAQTKLAGTSVVFSFQVQNPEIGQFAATPQLSITPVGLPPPALVSVVSGNPLRICTGSSFGSNCEETCLATATSSVTGGELGGSKGLWCLCGQDQFGASCELTVNPQVSAISVVAGTSLEQDLSSGSSISIPSSAASQLSGGSGGGGEGGGVQAKNYGYVRDMTTPLQEDITLSGSIVILEPSPYTFCTNTTAYPTCTDECAPTLCLAMEGSPPAGKTAGVHKFNTQTGLWANLGGIIQGSKICLVTCHWSTFGVFFVASPASGWIPNPGGIVGSSGGGGGGEKTLPSDDLVQNNISLSNSNLEAEVVLQMPFQEFTYRRVQDTHMARFVVSRPTAATVYINTYHTPRSTEPGDLLRIAIWLAVCSGP